MSKNLKTNSIEHKKLYKAGKNWIVASLATAFFFGGTLLSNQVNVHADAQTETASSQSAVTPDTLASDSAQVTKAQTAFNSASDNLNSTSAAYSDASLALDAAKQNTQTAKNKVDSLQSIINGSNVTSSTISQDKNSISSASDNVSKAQENVTSAQNSFNAASSAVEEQNKNVQSANYKVQAAQDVLDNKGLTQAQNAVSDAETTASNAAASLSSAKSAQSEAKSGNSNAASDAASASAALSEANSNVIVAQSLADSAQAAVTSAQNSVDNLQDSLKNIDNSLPTFHFTDQQKQLTQKVTKEWSDFCKAQSANSTDNFTKMPSYNAWADAMSEGGYNVKWTDNSAEDKAEKFDPNNLTTKNVQQLSEWTAAVLNQLTQQLGIQNTVGKVIVTNGMIDEAKEVAQLTTDNNQSGYGHYLYGLNKAAYDHGLTQSTHFIADQFKDKTYMSNPFGESAGGGYADAYKDYTLADAKEQVLSTILQMLSEDKDQGMGHTTALLGLQDLIYNDSKGQVLGVSISGNKNANSDMFNPITVHIIGYATWNVTPTSDMYKWNVNNDGAAKQKATKMAEVISNPYDDLATTKTNLRTQLTTAQQKLNDAKSSVDPAKSALAEAQKIQSKAKDSFDKANTALTSSHTSLQNANSKLEKAQKQNDDAQSALGEAQSYLASFTADQQEKQNKLNDAKKALQKETDKLDSLKKDQGKAKQSLNNANTSLTNAKNALAKAKDKLVNDEKVVKAQSELPQAKKDYSNLLKVQQEKQDALDKAKEANDQAVADSDKAINTLKAAKDKYSRDYNAYWTDARRFGNVVSVKPTTATIGNTPSPVVNDLTTDGNHIPAGTTAQWKNMSQVKEDANNLGDYTEEVLVSFPDGTSVLVNGDLTVKAAPKHNNANDNVVLPNGYRIVNNHVVDAKGNIVSNWTVSNGHAIPVSNVITNTTSKSENNNDNNSNVLPQTGEDSNEGVFALGFASLLATFGLMGINKKHA